MPALSSNGRNLKKVYVFDGRENYISEYKTVTACADALNVTRQAVTMAVSRASILDKKYYVSYKQTFIRQRKQKEFNPLRPPVRAPQAADNPTGPVTGKRAAGPKSEILSAAKAKAAAKRATDMALRSRSILHRFDEGGFGPFASFH
jgi:Zn-dependent peptidase ImmA (M78 family)